MPHPNCLTFLTVCAAGEYSPVLVHTHKVVFSGHRNIPARVAASFTAVQDAVRRSQFSLEVSTRVPSSREMSEAVTDQLRFLRRR